MSRAASAGAVWVFRFQFFMTRGGRSAKRLSEIMRGSPFDGHVTIGCRWTLAGVTIRRIHLVIDGISVRALPAIQRPAPDGLANAIGWGVRIPSLHPYASVRETRSNHKGFSYGGDEVGLFKEPRRVGVCEGDSGSAVL